MSNVIQEDNSIKHLEIPSEVNALVQQIKKTNLQGFEEFKDDNSHLLVQDDNLLLIYTMDEIAVMDTDFSHNFIKNTYAADIGYEFNLIPVFEVEDWYINPSKILGFHSLLPEVFNKQIIQNAIAINRFSVASFLLGHYGTYSQKMLGIDFTSKEWIDIFKKDMPLTMVLLQFLKALIYPEEYERFKIGLFNYEFRPSFDNESAYAVNFVLASLMNLDETLGHPEDADFMRDARIGACQIKENDWVYWVELYDMFIMYDGEDNGVISISPIDELIYTKDKEFNIVDFLIRSSAESESFNPNKYMN